MKLLRLFVVAALLGLFALVNAQTGSFLPLGIVENGEFNSVTANLCAGTLTGDGQVVSILDPNSGPLFLLAGSDGSARLEVYVHAPRNHEDRHGNPNYEVVYTVPQEPAQNADQSGSRGDTPAYWERPELRDEKMVPGSVPFHRRLCSADYLGHDQWSIRIPFQQLKPAIGKICIGIRGAAVGRKRPNVYFFMLLIPLRGHDVKESQDIAAFLPIVDGTGLTGYDQLRKAQVDYARNAMRTGSIAAHGEPEPPVPQPSAQSGGQGSSGQSTPVPSTPMHTVQGPYEAYSDPELKRWTIEAGVPLKIVLQKGFHATGEGSNSTSNQFFLNPGEKPKWFELDGVKDPSAVLFDIYDVTDPAHPHLIATEHYSAGGNG